MKIGERFEATRDAHGWTLLESYQGQDRDGNPKTMQRRSYHATLPQVVDKVIDMEAGQQQCLAAVLARVERLRDEIVERLEGK